MFLRLTQPVSKSVRERIKCSWQVCDKQVFLILTDFISQLPFNLVMQHPVVSKCLSSLIAWNMQLVLIIRDDSGKKIFYFNAFNFGKQYLCFALLIRGENSFSASGDLGALWTSGGDWSKSSGKRSRVKKVSSWACL